MAKLGAIRMPHQLGIFVYFLRCSVNSARNVTRDRLMGSLGSSHNWGWRIQVFGAILLKAIVLCSIVLAFGCTSTKYPVPKNHAVAQEKIKQYKDVLKTRREAKQRVINLAWPLLENNEEICRDSMNMKLGVSLVLPTNTISTLEQAREEIFGFDGHAVVEVVAVDSPAYIAGLRLGDKITRVGSYSKETASKRNNTREALTELNRLAANGQEFEIGMLRDNEEQTLVLKAKSVCRSDFRVDDSARINARTNGNAVTVNLGLLRFFDDHGVQAVIAHEMAHVVKRHVRNTLPRRGIGVILELATLTQGIWTGGALAGATSSMFQKGLEREADYVSMYILANAGIDTSDVKDVWREYASVNEQGIRGSMTHPDTAERYLTLESIHEEIEAKKANGEALIPN